MLLKSQSNILQIRHKTSVFTFWLFVSFVIVEEAKPAFCRRSFFFRPLPIKSFHKLL